MSNLESAAMPALTAMIEGRSVILNTGDQEAIAAWLSLKSVIVQFSRSDVAPNHEWVRAFYSSDGRPPPDWSVRIAQHKGRTMAQWTEKRFDFTFTHSLSPVPFTKAGFLTTLTLASFVGQVISVRHEAVPLNPYFIPIWPHPGIRGEPAEVGLGYSKRWPPERWLDESKLTKSGEDMSEPTS
jgi:hypothetical protein